MDDEAAPRSSSQPTANLCQATRSLEGERLIYV
jgi:hypothetical protein